MATNNIQDNAYTFIYDRYEQIPVDYLTNKYDHWGYYNGKENNIINDSSSAKATNAKSKLNYLQPNLSFATIGMLKKIIYPTGGTSTFVYELNNCRKAIADNKQSIEDFGEDINVGGLRIRSITNDDKNNISVKTYQYINPETQYSSGVLYSLPNTCYKWKLNDKELVANISCSIVPLANTFSPFIGYSFIRETNSDGSYIDYTFSNYDTEKDEKYMLIMDNLEFPNPCIEFSRRDYMCGKLLSRSVYGSNNKIKEESKYNYTTDNLFNSSNYVLTTAFTRIQRYNSNIYVGGSYKLFFPKVSVASASHTLYYYKNNETNHITSTANYTYEDHCLKIPNLKKGTHIANVRQLISSSVNVAGNNYKKIYTYPNYDSGSNFNLVSQFCMPITSEKEYENNALISGRKVNYGKCNNYYVPSSIIEFYDNENNSKTITSFTKYSETYKPTEYIDETGMYHQYYWGKNDKLLAIVDNGSDKITFNSSASNASDLLTEVFNDEPINVTACIYNSRGFTHNLVTRNRQTTYYKYDLFGRLTESLDNNNKTIQRTNYHFMTSNDINVANVISEKADNSYNSLSNSYSVNYISSENSSELYHLFYDRQNQRIRIGYQIPINSKSVLLYIYDAATKMLMQQYKLSNNYTSNISEVDISSLNNNNYYATLYVDGTETEKKQFTKTKKADHYYIDPVEDRQSQTIVFYCRTAPNVHNYLYFMKESIIKSSGNLDLSKYTYREYLGYSSQNSNISKDASKLKNDKFILFIADDKYKICASAEIYYKNGEFIISASY